MDLFASPLQRSAVLSDCGAYRYRLTRRWDDTRPTLPFVMLNPSTADAEQDDPTIRRCMSFARREGGGGIVVVNLYAYRATDPKRLSAAGYPVGPLNREHVRDVAQDAGRAGVPVVCAWGVNDVTQAAGGALAWAKHIGTQLVCLGKTLHGHPRHPLYVRSDQPLEAYP